MSKLINSFFDEEELELVSVYSLLIKLALISTIITMLGVIA